MASLNGTTPAATYQSLIKFNDNGAISATLKALSDGAGGASSIYLSSTQVNIGGTGLINARLGVKGTGTTSATFGLRVENSTAAKRIYYDDAGTFKVEDGGNTSYFSALESRFYAFGSPSVGALKIDFNGGAVDMYPATAALQARFAAAYNSFITPLKIGAAIGAPNAVSLFELESTTKGLLFPRMTTAQKTAIAAVAGLVVYDTTTSKLCCYNGATWNDLF